MKVLFVSSGNSRDGISPIVFNQGESLKKAGVVLDYFTIKGKGIAGYSGNILNLRNKPINRFRSIILIFFIF